MACTFNSVGLNGYNNDAVGQPRKLEIYARLSGACTKVKFDLRLWPNGPSVFNTISQVGSNNSASAAYYPLIAFPCGRRFWLTLSCAEGDTCTASGWVTLECKTSGPGGTSDGDNGNNGNNNGNGGNDNGNWPSWPNWPWPWPPAIVCPLIGRLFIFAFMAGLTAIVLGVWSLAILAIAAGVGVIVAAFAALAVWRIFCAPPPCHVVGAMLWAIKRVAVGALFFGLITLNVPTVVFTLALGIAGGWCTVYLRQNRCFIPKFATPLANLPLW